MTTEGAYTENSQSTLALVMAILGLCCGPLAIVGLVLSTQEMTGIDAGRRPPENRGTANAARIISFVAIGLWVLGLIGNFAFMGGDLFSL